jgi:hypothetical protein
MTDARSTIFAALIAAVAGLAGVYAGYVTGEKEYELEHHRIVTDLIIKLADEGGRNAPALVGDFCVARVFDNDTIFKLNRIWSATNPKDCAYLK